MQTWAFEFEDKPYFDGYRTLATNGVDKPILNFFRMAGLMRGVRVAATSSGAIPLDSIQKSGVRQTPDVDALAASGPGEASVMLWNYHDDDVAGPDSSITVSLKGIATTAHRVLLQQYRIDANHSNAYTVWKEMGSPQHPSRAEYSILDLKGGLETMESPQSCRVKDGVLELHRSLPRQAVSLLRLDF